MLTSRKLRSYEMASEWIASPDIKTRQAAQELRSLLSELRLVYCGSVFRGSVFYDFKSLALQLAFILFTHILSRCSFILWPSIAPNSRQQRYYISMAASSSSPFTELDGEVEVLHQSPATLHVATNLREYFHRAARRPGVQSSPKRPVEVDEVIQASNYKRARLDTVEPIDISDGEDAPTETALRRSVTIATISDIADSDDEDPNDVLLQLGDFMTDSQFRSHLRRLQSEKSKAKTQIPFFETPQFRCTSGRTVELQNGTFLRIKEVLRDGHGNIFVSGLKLVRQNKIGPKMPQRRNELIIIRELPPGAHKATLWEHLVEISVDDIIRNRLLICTNLSHPNISIRDDHAAFTAPLDDVYRGPLFCRWSLTTLLNERRTPIECTLERLLNLEADNTIRRSQHGIDQHTRVPNQEVRNKWRGFPTTLGGSRRFSQPVTNLDGISGTLEEGRTYTIGDAFCGAGGMARGAVEAGLKLLWGFDMDAEAIVSYRHNFERLGVDCREETVDAFITRLVQLVSMSDVRVDILHLSPPCQPFSPAHTVANMEKDEANQAALPSVFHMIEFLQPRIVTMEETEGLFSRHKEWFDLLINCFASHGYSVRWKTINCVAYGVPQSRKRLVIIAAGPGEALPSFPDPTHYATDPGLKPLATINDAIINIPRTAMDHNTAVRSRRPRVPFSGNTIAKTITTNAGQGNYHPSGLRLYTPRELACLQTFPMHHSFAGAPGVTKKRKQIGNAVPPKLAKAIFRSVIKSLKESDGV